MLKFGLKEVLILLHLALGYPAASERLGSLGLSPGFGIYAALFGILAAALFLTAHIRNGPLRWLCALILAASAFFLDSFERVTADHMSYDVFITMLSSTGSEADALFQHRRAILLSLLSGSLLLLGIGLKPRPMPRQVRLASFFAAPAAVLLLAAILFARGGEGARGLPGAFPPLSYSALLAYEAGTGEVGPRQPVRLRPAAPLAGRDIVLIIDESIAGNYLDLNTKGGARSGLAEPRPGVRIHRYGYAASITNCSVGVNVTLRYGGTRSDYRRINAVMPSVWAYAKQAGMRTAYLDAQLTGGRLHSLMDAAERREIDDFTQFDAVPVRDRDMAVADKLAELLGNDRSDFILVNKVGAHFPIHDKYPDAFMRHRPVLPRGGWLNVAETGSRAGFGGSAEDWVRYRNAYRNTLEWNVGAFFDRLLARADLSRATIVYTSDHGQDLHERGNAGSNTHCGTEPAAEEGLVTLVAIEGEHLNTLPWEQNLAANRNRVSHYQIFPTLLALMGYEQAAVQPIYGDTLVVKSRDDFTFNTRFNARLGKEPVWKKIDLNSIVQPPAADSEKP